MTESVQRDAAAGVVAQAEDERGSTGGISERVDSGPIEDLEKGLESACETLATIGSSVLDFSFDAQETLFSQVNQFVADLAHIDAKAKLVGAQIPVEVLEAIDRGRNPEHCTFQMLESCADASSAALGKQTCMGTFRQALEKAMTDAGMSLPTQDEIDEACQPRALEKSAEHHADVASATESATEAADTGKAPM